MKEQYYGETIARSIMFSNNIEKFLKSLKSLLSKLDVNMASLLKIINDTFMEYASNGFLSGKGKTNIYMYMNFINSEIKLSKEANDVFTFYYRDIIDMLNNDVTDKKMDEFYRTELAIRKNSKKYYNPALVSSDKISEMISQTNDSIEGELNVLHSHLDLDDCEYWNKQITYISSPTFTESARYLVHKYPGLVGEKKFKDRLCATLETKETFNKKYRRNVFRRLTLEPENAYLGQIRFGRNDKKLYKQVVGM